MILSLWISSKIIKWNNTPDKITQRKYASMCDILHHKTENDNIAVIEHIVKELKMEVNQRYAEHMLEDRDESWATFEQREAKKDSLECMKEIHEELIKNIKPTPPSAVDWSLRAVQEKCDIEEKERIRKDSLAAVAEADSITVAQIQKEADASIYAKRKYIPPASPVENSSLVQF